MLYDSDCDGRIPLQEQVHSDVHNKVLVERHLRTIGPSIHEISRSLGKQQWCTRSLPGLTHWNTPRSMLFAWLHVVGARSVRAVGGHGALCLDQSTSH